MLVDGTFCDKYLCMMYWSMSRSKRNTNPVHGRQMVIIGAGNVATHFAHAFSAAGYAIVQVYSKTIDSARALAGQFGVGCTNSLSLLRTDADIYIFAVSDDALFDIALDLKLKDKICFHTSGTVPMDVLSPITKNYGVVYVPQTFIKHIAMDYSRLPFCVEASNVNTLDMLKAMASTISSSVYSLNGEQRRYLHLASVFASNFGNCINAMAQQIMEQHNLPFEIIHPLISETAKKIQYGNLWSLQTGPAKRGDTKTLDKHRRLLIDDSKALEVYNLLSSIIEEKTK